MPPRGGVNGVHYLRQRLFPISPLDQAHTGATTIFSDELNPGGFQGGADCGDGAWLEFFPPLEARHRISRNPSKFSQFPNAEPQSNTGHPRLHWQ